MNPQQDYSFIMQNNGTNKSPILAPKTQKQRIFLVLFITGAIVLLGILLMIIINIFSVDNSKKLTDLAITQNEIQRIMDIGVKDSKDGGTKALAQTASSIFATHKQSTITLASKKNIKISDKQLSATKSTETNKKLEQAKNANNFDEVFLEIYDAQLVLYSQKVKELYESENDKSIKTALNNFYKDAGLMPTNYISK